jgi:hypothetical protein
VLLKIKDDVCYVFIEMRVMNIWLTIAFSEKYHAHGTLTVISLTLFGGFVVSSSDVLL